MVRKQNKSYYSKILAYILPTLSSLIMVSYFIPNYLSFYFGGIVVLIIVVAFCIILVNLVVKRLPPPTNEEQLIFNANKSLPNVKYEAQPKLLRRLRIYIVMALLLFVTIINYQIVLMLSTIFIPVVFIFFFFTGSKPISFIEFTNDGIYFHTRAYELFGFGGEYFIPYEQCFVGFMSGVYRFGYDESLLFSKGKMPYITISLQGWGKTWKNVVEETYKRLPESRLPK